MVICGQEFKFSALNADDLERVETAQEHLKQADAAEKQRRKTGIADTVCGQCRLVMRYLDEVLGEGASERLGLNGRDFDACRQVMDEFAARIAEQQESLHQRVQFMNRDQRRAEKKARQRTQTAGHIVSQQPVSFPAQPPAARMVERVDKARRRDPEDAALHLANARIAMDSLRDDPEAMQQLADYALRLAAGRHV